MNITRERIFSFIVFIPYFEGLLSFLNIYIDNAVFRSINLILAVIGLILFFYPNGKIKIICSKYKTELFLPLYLILSLLWINLNWVSWSTLTWMITPIIFAIIFSTFLIAKKIDILVFLRDCIQNYAVYCFIAVVYGIIKDHAYIDFSVRLSPPGGGAVIFSYATLIYLVMMFLLNSYFTDKQIILFICLFLIAILGTESRAAVWPSFLFSAVYIFKASKKSKVMAIFAIFILLMGIIALFVLPDILSKVAPRLLRAHDYARGTSLQGVKWIFSNSSFSNKLFGYGLGNVFQYQQWLINVGEGIKAVTDIFFVYKGGIILVQPHNNYFYYLLETGVLGVVLFVAPFIKYIYTSIKYKKIWYFLFIISILFINCFDSAMIVEPGVSAMIYIFAFLLYYEITTSKNAKKGKAL